MRPMRINKSTLVCVVTPLLMIAALDALAADLPQEDIRQTVSRIARSKIEEAEGRSIEYPNTKCVELLSFVRTAPGMQSDTARARPAKPVLVKTGGQSGAGKSGVVNKIVERLWSDPGGVTHFDWDNMRQYMPPDYIRHLHMLDPELSALYRPDVMAQPAGRIIHEALDDKRNLILDGSLDTAVETRKSMEDYASRGYEVQVVVIAAHPLFARAGDLLRMAKTSMALQEAVEAASRLPPEERDSAILAAKSKYFPRHSLLQRHTDDVLNQVNSLDELEHLMTEAKVQRIEIWERDRTTPTFLEEAENGQKIVSTSNSVEGVPQAKQFDVSGFPIGQASSVYRAILSRWTEQDQVNLHEQLAEAQTLLGRIHLPEIDVPKYFRYATEIERAGNDELRSHRSVPNNE